MGVRESEFIHGSPFAKRLRRAHKVAAMVAAELDQEGFNVELGTIGLDPKSGVVSGFKDSGDIIIKIHGGDQILEVKEISMRFRSAEAFPINKIIVDRVEVWNDKDPKPLAYINVSRKIGGRLVIFTGFGSSDEWWIERIHNKIYGSESEYYFIRKSSRFVKSWEYFLSWLKRFDGR